MSEKRKTPNIYIKIDILLYSMISIVLLVFIAVVLSIINPAFFERVKLLLMVALIIALLIVAFNFYIQIVTNKRTRINNLKKEGFYQIKLPSALKDLFIDSLRAFENYAKLSRYEIKFSFDNAENDILGFKFTITENPNNLSNDEIRADIKEFLEKIQRGERFDDLPVVINPFEHQMVLTTLKNRISFIEHSFTMEKNMRELYEKAVRDLLATKNLFAQQPMTVNNNYLQSGGENSSKQIDAKSSNINVGDNNFIEDKSINIEHSFNEKKTIVEKIEYSIQQIDNEGALNPQQKQDLKRHLENIKEEITEEANPDTSKLKKSWDKIKKVAENLVLSKELTDALEWIGGMFNF